MNETIEKILFRSVEQYFPCQTEDYLYYKKEYESTMEQMKEYFSEEDYGKLFETVTAVLAMECFKAYYYFCVGCRIGRDITQELNPLLQEE